MGCKSSYSGRTITVLLAANFGLVILGTTVYSSGIIYVSLLDRFGQGEARTSLVGAFTNGFLCFTAPIGGVLVHRFSSRVAIVTGAVISTLGFALSAFAPNLSWLVVTAGVLVGSGNGMTLTGFNQTFGCYVKKHRDIVLSCQFLVTCLGMFLSTPLSLYIIEHVGLDGLFFVFAGLHAQICVIGVLAKPNAVENGLHRQRQSPTKHGKKGCVKSFINLSLLKNIPFMCFLLSTTAWNFALIFCFIHIPNYLLVLGRTKHDVEKIMTALTVAVVTGRVLGVVTVSKYRSKSIHFHIAVTALSGILTATFPLYFSDVGLYVFTMQLGGFTGWCNSMMVVACLSFVGLSNLAESYGFCFFFCGIGTTAGPIVIAYFYSLTGSYEYSFIVAGVLLLVGSLFGLVSLGLRARYTIDKEQNGAIKDAEQDTPLTAVEPKPVA